jgi:hypothetical protein
MYTAQFTECHELLAHIPADSETTEINTGWILMENVHRAVILISVGDLAGSATFDVDIEQASDSSGTGVKAITGKSITQLTATDDDVALAIELRAEELDVAGGFEYIRVECTPAVAAVEFAVLVLGVVQRYRPVGVTAWQEVVA